MGDVVRVLLALFVLYLFLPPSWRYMTAGLLQIGVVLLMLWLVLVTIFGRLLPRWDERENSPRRRW